LIGVQRHYKIVSAEDPSEPSVTLSLNGKLSEEAIPELEHSIVEARESHQRVYIDLSEVTLVDRKAVQYISRRAAADVKLVNCPIYLRRWISQVSDEIEQ
jgi:ABC-type transporter Mla MlaB component